MPIYAYRCAECGHQVEMLQKVSDAPLKVCPACHHAALVKQVTAAGFQLKGSGWYVTDFREGKSAKKEAAKTDAPANGDAAKPETGAGAGSSDTAAKPAESASAEKSSESKPASPAPAPTTD